MNRPVAVVTGGSRGIGEATVRRLARRGLAVVFSYTSDEEGAERVQQWAAHIGVPVRGLRCDITSAEAPGRLLDAADRLGELTALINNAGITGPIGPLRDVSDQTIARVLDVNLGATVRLCRDAVSRWSQGDRDRDRSIVNVTSIAARTGAPGEYVWYAASKAGVETLTVGLAREVAELGIRVNAVSPGTTRTTIHARAGRPNRADEVGARTPLGRAAWPDEVAAAIDWLTTSEAGYITGSVLDVAGGLR